MIRARFVIAATFVGAGLAAGVASGQQGSKAADFKPILTGKNFVSPVRGAADVEFAKPASRREKDMVVDEFTVKNVSSGPIARLTIESIFYDKASAVIAGGKASINGLLQPGEVQTVRVQTPFNARMSSSNYKFTHANGVITPKKVDKIVDPAAAEKAAAAKKAAADKAAAAKAATK
jgi:hypothetical protein